MPGDRRAESNPLFLRFTESPAKRRWRGADRAAAVSLLFFFLLPPSCLDTSAQRKRSADVDWEHYFGYRVRQSGLGQGFSVFAEEWLSRRRGEEDERGVWTRKKIQHEICMVWIPAHLPDKQHSWALFGLKKTKNKKNLLSPTWQNTHSRMVDWSCWRSEATLHPPENCSHLHLSVVTAMCSTSLLPFQGRCTEHKYFPERDAIMEAIYFHDPLSVFCFFFHWHLTLRKNKKHKE